MPRGSLFTARLLCSPGADMMRMFAQTHTARELAERAEVPILAGSPLLNSSDEALDYARRVGLPVLLKATGKHAAAEADGNTVGAILGAAAAGDGASRQQTAHDG